MSDNARILIVDDEPYNVDYLQQELEDSPFDIAVAFDGQQALDSVAAAMPDLILLDIMMPVMDGYDVLRRLKSDPATRDIPVIVISASTSLQSVVKGIELGAEDYLPKPFEPTLLQARISASMARKRLHDLERLYLQSLERELVIARDIQSSFLPGVLPVVEGWQIAAYFKAARVVAGDFYDAFLLPDGALVSVIGDVCGKGVGAALFMTLFRSLIRATATTRLSRDPLATPALTLGQRLQHVVSFTNEYVAQTHGDAHMFATLFIAMFDPASGEGAYMNCGNEPPLLLRRDGSLLELAPTGPVVGIFSGAYHGIREIRLEPGDLLLTFTDGIPDALNDAGEHYGTGPLLEQLRAASLSPGRLMAAIQDEIHHFIGQADQFDDITLLAIGRD